MERSSHLSLIPAFLLIFLCLIVSHASEAAGYNYYVDYFRVQGSVNKQDNFNDGKISPWVAVEGTVEESGGSVILKNPGQVEIYGNVVEETTELDSPIDGTYDITVGSGNVKATSRWITNVEPFQAQAYWMGADFEFDTGNPNDEGEIYISTGIVNADQVTADFVSTIVGTTVPTGLFAFFEVGRYVSGIVEARVFQIAPIVDVTVFDEDSLFLNLHYDDFAQEVAASIVFGNDEDGNAWKPFNKVAIPSHPGDLVFDEWELGVNSFSAVPVPAALPLFASALSLLSFMGWKYRKLNSE
jgi:hypothetical protein